MTLRYKIHRYGNLAWFWVPAIVLTAIFAYVPMAGLVMAFKENPNLMGSSGGPIRAILDADWVGLKWFKEIFSKREILNAIRNTLIINVQKIVFLFPIPIFMAIFISEMSNQKLKKGLQSIMYIPNFLSWVTVAGIFITLLNKDTGLVNNILAFFGYERYAFVSSNDTFRGVLVVSAAWKFLGWNSITYVAAITALDRDTLESARVDGANRLQQIIHVTLPGIMPTIAVMFVLRVAALMDGAFDQVFMFYSPYIKETGDLLSTYTYRLVREAGMMPQYGLSTAIGLVNSVVALVLVLGGNYISRHFFHRGLW